MLVGSAIIFTFVMLLLALAWRRKGTQAPDRIWFWGLGLAFPIVTLTALTVYGLVVGERLRPVADTTLVVVRAEARQWAWSFGYADAPGRVTDDILHIPAGRPVDVEITSLDVIHAFWVPRLAGKLDAIPGRVNRLRLQADQPGDYAGASAEFSGAGYREHVFTVRAHDPAAWAAFLGTEQP
jgi:heme/copper-type cytochrome/quinol oxidase subunit 2